MTNTKTTTRRTRATGSTPRARRPGADGAAGVAAPTAPTATTNARQSAPTTATAETTTTAPAARRRARARFIARLASCAIRNDDAALALDVVKLREHTPGATADDPTERALILSAIEHAAALVASEAHDEAENGARDEAQGDAVWSLLDHAGAAVDALAAGFSLLRGGAR